MPSSEEIKRRLAEMRAAAAAPPPPAPVKEPTPATAPTPVVAKPTTTPTAKTPTRPPAPKLAPPKPAVAPAAPVAAPTAFEGTPEYERQREAWIKSLPPEQQQAARDLDRLAVEQKERETAREGARTIATAQREASLRPRELRAPENVGEAVDKALRPIVEPAKAVGTMLLPAVGEAVGNIGTGRGSASTTAGQARKEAVTQEFDREFQEQRAEQAAKQAEEQERKAARQADVLGDDPKMQAATRLAESLRAEETARSPTANGKFIKARTISLLTEKLEARGGTDAVTSGPEYESLYQQAKTEAVEELVKLHMVGAWNLSVSPKDAAGVDDAPVDFRAFLPKQELRPGGKVIRSESLPSWFFTVPLSVVDAAVLTAVQPGMKGSEKVEDKDLTERFLSNVSGRQDVVSWRIEQDPELQADLSSDDPERVRRAVATITPYLLTTILTPDPVSVATAGAGGTLSGAKILRYSPTIVKDLKAAPSAAEKAKVLWTAGQRAAEAEKVAKVEATAQRALNATEQVKGGVDFDEVVQQMRTSDPAVAVRMQDDLARVLSTDPAVQTYLDYLGTAADDVSLRNMPEVGFSPLDADRRVELGEEITRLEQAARAQRKAYRADLEDADEGALPGELKAALKPTQDRLARLRTEVRSLNEKEMAARGREAAITNYPEATRRVVEDLDTQARGGVVPKRTVEDYTGVAQRAEPPEVDPGVFGPDVTPALAERLAGAATPEELVGHLSRVSPDVRERIAQSLGFDGYDDLKAATKATTENVAEQRTKLAAQLAEQRAKLSEAMDREAALKMAPEQAAAYAAARKEMLLAEKEVTAAEKALVAAGQVDIRAQQKLAKMEKALTDLRTKLEADIAAAEAELAKAEKNVKEPVDEIEEAIEKQMFKAAKPYEDTLTIKSDPSPYSKNPPGIKNVTDQGGIPTTGEQVRRLEEQLAQATQKLNDWKLDAPEAKALADAQEALRAFEAPTAPRVQFKTAKGSVYTVDADGTTTRVKAARPEHPGDSGLQEKSQGTVYVDADGLDRLGIFQTQGGVSGKHLRVSGDEAAVFGTQPDGKVQGLATSRTKVSKQPFVGGYPVEWWKDGAVVHFGNQITEVVEGAPKLKAGQRAVKKKALTADVEKAQAAYDAAVKPLLDDLSRIDLFLNKKSLGVTADGGWRGKLAKVQERAAKVKLDAENEIAKLRAMQKAGTPVAPRAPNTAKVDKARKALEELRAKSDGTLQIAEAETRKLRDAVNKAREESNALYETSLERAKAAQERYDKAQASYGGVSKPSTRVSQGAEWDERVRGVEADVAKRRDALAATSRDYFELLRAPDVRANLERALAAARPEMQRVSGQMRAREAFLSEQMRVAQRYPGENPEVFLERDRSQLISELELIDRNLRRAKQRQQVAEVGRNLFRAARDVMQPWAETQEQSLTAAWRDAMRRLQGELEDVGAGLARSVTEITDGDEPNLRALNAVADEVPAFKDAVLDKQIASDYAAYIIGAYLQSDVSLDPARAKRLAQVLSDWAVDPSSTLVDLRTRLLEATRREMGDRATSAQLQKPQLGDALLAYGVGSAGATQRVMRDNGLLLLSPSGAEDVNAVLTDLHRLGGNPRASIGRQRLLRGIVDPEAYRPTLRDPRNVGLAESASSPMVPAYGRAGLPRPTPEAVDAARREIGQILDATDEMFRREIYVPRAVRDIINQQIDAVIATRRIPQQYGTDAAFNYWRQAVIVGVGLSNPAQGFMDHMGDLWQIATKHPLVAVKTALRSSATQALHVPFMAQAALLIDALRKNPAGTAAKDFDRIVSLVSFSPEVQKVLDRSNDVIGSTGMTGRQVWKALQDEGLPENLVTSQVTRTLAIHGTKEVPRTLSTLGGAAQGAGAGVVVGGPVGALVGGLAGALFGYSDAGRRLAAANHEALVDLANIAATRRRVALAISLMEKGMAPKQAGAEAVRLVGAFSREIGPTERKFITSWFPFFAYRKFNTRRTLLALKSPYFMKALNEGGNAAALLANAVLDDTDEYGFHHGPMSEEPDPLKYDAILLDLSEKHPGWSREMLYEQANLAAKGLPKASERYNRLVAALRAMPYEQAKRYALNPDLYPIEVRQQNPGMSDDEVVRITGQVVEDLNALRPPYWAPDPVREGLPEYLKERYTLYLGKARSQALQNIFRSGQGRAEKPSDEERTYSPFQDPNLDGVAMLLAAPAILSNLTPLSEGEAGADVLGVAFRDPFAQTLLNVAGLVNPDGTTDTVIPQDVGENLLRAGLGDYVEVRTPQGIPYDPANPDQEGVREVRYVIPARASAAMYLMPFMFGGALGSMRLMSVKETLEGDRRTSGPPDAVDEYGSYAFFASGFPVRQSSPSQLEFFDKLRVDKRVDEALDKVRSAQLVPPKEVTRMQRYWSSLAEEEGFAARVQAAKEGLRQNRAPSQDDMNRLRAVLVMQARSPEDVLSMSDIQVVREFMAAP